MGKEAKEVFVSDSAAMCHDVDAPFWHSQQDLSRNLRVKGRRPHRTKKIFIESVDTLSRPLGRKCRYNIRLASVCMAAMGFTRQNSRENSSRKEAPFRPVAMASYSVNLPPKPRDRTFGFGKISERPNDMVLYAHVSLLKS